jgi:RimJ/RimL family protein N-acetyltransferase
LIIQCPGFLLRSWLDSDEVDGEAAGSIAIKSKLDVYRMNAEIGYFLGEKYWGRGIVTEVLQSVVMYGFETFDIIIRDSCIYSILKEDWGQDAGCQ